MIGFSALTAQANDYPYKLESEILVGTCNVSLPNKNVRLDDVEREQLNNGAILNSTALELIVDACGIGNVNTSPSLIITGNTLDTSIPIAGKYLFNHSQTQGIAKGYGIVLSKKKLTTWDTDSLITNNDYINVNSLNESLHIGIACGDSATCINSDIEHTAGSLTALITFTFGYK